jgi:hypothetical protein
MNEPKSTGLLKIEGGCLWPGVGAVVAVVIIIAAIFISAMNRLSHANEEQSIDITVVPFSSSTATQGQVDVDITATVLPERTPDSGEVIIYSMGELVEIYGTEGDGLRLRNAPGLDATINELALENEVFEIRGGPEELDGYVWWFLINPYNNTIQGWSVGNFLRRLGT